MSDERREAFVGKVSSYRLLPGSVEVVVLTDEVFVPATTVVVIPLLPDDPRPGETWLYYDGGSRLTSMMEVTVTGAPFPSADGPRVPVDGPNGWFAPRIAWLTRPPVLKTFRLDLFAAAAGLSGAPYIDIEAESKGAALAKLSEALEEVSDV